MNEQRLREILLQYARDIGGIWDHEGDSLDRAIEQIKQGIAAKRPEEQWTKTP